MGRSVRFTSPSAESCRRRRPWSPRRDQTQRRISRPDQRLRPANRSTTLPPSSRRQPNGTNHTATTRTCRPLTRLSSTTRCPSHPPRGIRHLSMLRRGLKPTLRNPLLTRLMRLILATTNHRTPPSTLDRTLPRRIRRLCRRTGPAQTPPKTLHHKPRRSPCQKALLALYPEEEAWLHGDVAALFTTTRRAGGRKIGVTESQDGLNRWS
mmetsp:Transcript_61873/g.152349  ORF Transcript_61873/g.152349 Transcript_61873/m.152349 type:complete len:209 (-) Transcript_61873:1428-2054(-)